MLVVCAVDWPCLSFDFIRDSLGHFRTKFPMSFYMAAGTQAANVKENKVSMHARECGLRMRACVCA